MCLFHLISATKASAACLLKGLPAAIADAEEPEGLSICSGLPDLERHPVRTLAQRSPLVLERKGSSFRSLKEDFKVTWARKVMSTGTLVPASQPR